MQYTWFKQTTSSTTTHVPDPTSPKIHVSDITKKEEETQQDRLQRVMPPRAAYKTVPMGTQINEIWTPFAKQDCLELEKAYLAYEAYNNPTVEASSKGEPPPNKVAVAEDHLFDVDLTTNEIYPVYWEGPVFSVRRALWLIQAETNRYVPCDHLLHQQVEDGWNKFTSTEHQNSEKELKWNLFGPYSTHHVRFSAQQVLLVSDSLASKLSRPLSSRGMRLVRGYPEETPEPTMEPPDKEAVDIAKGADYQPSTGDTLAEMKQMSRLILVVHGIGQKMSEKYDWLSFIHDVNTFRSTLKATTTEWRALSQENPNKQKENTSPSSKINKARADSAPPQIKKSRSLQNLAEAEEHHPSGARKLYIPRGSGCMVLPVQWRRQLSFVPSTSDEPLGKWMEPTSLEDVTLDTVPGIRMMISDVCMDVLFYLVPEHAQSMINSLVSHMNRLYSIFVSRHPTFLENSGKVSVLAHSLGSVLSIDLLCNMGTTHNGVKYGKLDFDVDNFFAVGSPVGLFMTLKAIRLARCLPNGEVVYAGKRVNSPQDDPEPFGLAKFRANRLFNMFHACDPVAYRLEPMIHTSLSTLKPVPMPYSKGGLRGLQVGLTDYTFGIMSRTQGLMTSVKSSIGMASLGMGGWGKAVIAADAEAQKSKMEQSASQAKGTSEKPKAGLLSSFTSWMGSSEDIKPVAEAVASADISELHETDERLIASPVDVLALLNDRHGRIDFVMQDGVLENPYLAAMKSHFGYWDDADVSFFLLRELFGEVSENILE